MLTARLKLETTGGEASHTLTVNEMPSHNHVLRAYKDSTAPSNYGTTVPAKWWTDNVSSSVTESAGGSQPHNNMPPYLAVFMWKRTA